jgi:hypothetical protein
LILADHRNDALTTQNQPSAATKLDPSRLQRDAQLDYARMLANGRKGISQLNSWFDPLDPSFCRVPSNQHGNLNTGLFQSDPLLTREPPTRISSPRFSSRLTTLQTSALVRNPSSSAIIP